MKVTEKIASKVINGITSTEQFGWPPDCWGLFYQPERPTQGEAAHCVSEDKELTNK